jgi:uncharacterized protein YjbI with pentapeptide repeats
MSVSFIGQTFDKVDFKAVALAKGEYEDCTFIQCDFSGVDLSVLRFVDCSFKACNLSLAKLMKTGFHGVAFAGCKMWGLHFDQCSEFGLSFSFDNCSLNHSSFYQVKIKKTIFKDCQLHECDLTECDLGGAKFENCDFASAVFERTILEKADLSSARNYVIDPELNKIKKAKFSIPEVVGLLSKYDIEITS